MRFFLLKICLFLCVYQCKSQISRQEKNSLLQLPKHGIIKEKANQKKSQLNDVQKTHRDTDDILSSRGQDKKQQNVQKSDNQRYYKESLPKSSRGHQNGNARNKHPNDRTKGRSKSQDRLDDHSRNRRHDLKDKPSRLPDLRPKNGKEVGRRYNPPSVVNSQGDTTDEKDRDDGYMKMNSIGEYLGIPKHSQIRQKKPNSQASERNIRKWEKMTKDFEKVIEKAVRLKVKLRDLPHRLLGDFRQSTLILKNFLENLYKAALTFSAQIQYNWQLTGRDRAFLLKDTDDKLVLMDRWINSLRRLDAKGQQIAIDK